MDSVISNWYMIVGALALGLFCSTMIFNFFRLPTKEQRRKVKEWLLYAVTEAERELGSGTGQLKLRKVYDMFCTRFPMAARAVSFDTFCLWVDEALEKMKEMLRDNKVLLAYTEGKNDNEKSHCK